MIERILFPTDFSEHAIKCIEYIVNMKDCGVKEAILLHVIDYKIVTETNIVFEQSIDETKIIASHNEAAEKNLDELASLLNKENIKTETIIRAGSPFAEILKVAEEKNVSMIIMGHKGHSLAGELLLGSTAEKVARKSKVSVMLVK